MAVQWLVGDVRERMADIPDASIALVATSPPFIALRSYLPADHPDKALEIGSEPDPASFIDTLLALTAEWGRVLAPWGSIAIELGDTYAGSSMTGGDDAGSTRYPDGRSSVQEIHAPRRTGRWPRAKCLALVPQLYATSLAYGRNLLTGQPSPAGQWPVRNVIVWHRPNPAVGALGDKVRPSTSYIVVATRSPKRWYDLTAVRGDPVAPEVMPGAPPLDCWFDEHDVWTVASQGSTLAHYAMWPPKLAERLLLMMCPKEVCSVCGEPRRRIGGTYTLNAYRNSTRTQTIRAVALADKHELTDEHIAAIHAVGINDTGKALKINSGAGKNSVETQRLADEARAVLGGYFREFTMTTTASIDHEWTDCGHGSFVPGVVLDPFCGTGTTLAVATIHGRDAIGIDIDERNRALYEPRLAECRRALFGTKPVAPGQGALFDS